MMIHPTFDRSGYPTEATLRRIRLWPFGDQAGFWSFVKAAWQDNGKIRMSQNRIDLITGGWSGNESIVHAIGESMIGSYSWESSHRGGLHRYEIERPKTKKRKGKGGK